MLFRNYLHTTGESQRGFGRRVKISNNTVKRLCMGLAVKKKIANLVVAACNGMVRLEDLVIQTGYTKLSMCREGWYNEP